MADVPSMSCCEWFALIAIFGPIFYGLIRLFIWQHNRCTLCWVKMNRHPQHWNMMVCPSCGKVKVYD